MKNVPTINSSRRKIRKGKNRIWLIFLELILVLVFTSEYRLSVRSVYARNEHPSSYHDPESKVSFRGGSSFENGSDERPSSSERTSRRKVTASKLLFLTERTSKIFDIKRYNCSRCFGGGIGRKIFPGSRRQSLTIATQVMGGADCTNGDVPMPIPYEDSPNETLAEESALPTGIKDSVLQQASQSLMIAQQILSRIGPSFLVIVSLFRYNNDKDGVSFFNLYAMSLLGASCGFYIFLYFISLGYALGVTVPVVGALFVYQKQKVLPRATIFHSYITILWGVRLFAYLTFREYVSWPALHQKVMQVQAKMEIPFASKLLCWFAYSFFYVALMSSCWSRLSQDPSMSASAWGMLGRVGLTLQVLGWLLESIADSQKNGFKSRHRHSWCNVGVWKLSTHPNYLGEGLFWWGTYLANGFHSLPLTLLATIGLGFIMMVLKGAARSLSSKQKEKYGQEADFYEFQRTHNVFGPKHWWWWLHGMEELSRPVVPNVIATPSTAANNETSGQLLEDGSSQTITNGGSEEMPTS